MGASIADFRARFPEFDSPVVEDPRLQLALNDAALEINDAILKGRSDIAQMYLAAHKLASALRGVGGAGGPVTSKRANGLGISYGGGGSTNGSGLATTSYGAEYLRIIKSSDTTPRLA